MSVVYAYHFILLHQLRHLPNQEPCQNLSTPCFLLQSLKEMSLKVQIVKQEFLAHHGFIKLIVSYDLRSLRKIILWAHFINMDRQSFEEMQTTMSEEEKKREKNLRESIGPKNQNNKSKRKIRR